MTNEPLASEVWRLEGVTGSTPGLLRLDDGEVRLELFDDDDQLSSAFSVPLAMIDNVKWPKLQMSGGCSFEVSGEKYRISFLQPQNTRTPLASGAVAGVASIGSGRSAGKMWKAVLPS